LNQEILSSFKKEKKRDSRKVNRRLNNNAHQIVSTVNPETNLSASNIIRALIISKNKPNVSMVMGKVSIIKIGLTIKFRRPNTMATMIAVV
jgi:hypothetical protein